MRDFTFANVLRYMFPSMVVFSYLYVCEPAFVEGLGESVESLLLVIGTIAFIFLGSILYFLYRPIYHHFILWIQDIFRWKSDNYRTYLKKHYRDSYRLGTYEAMQLWFQIRSKYLEERYSQAMKETASGVHLIYLVGIIATFFAIWRFVISDFILGWVFLVIFVLCFLGAFFLDRSYEDIEVRFFFSLRDEKKEEIHLFASRILQNVFPTSNK